MGLTACWFAGGSHFGTEHIKFFNSQEYSHFINGTAVISSDCMNAHLPSGMRMFPLFADSAEPSHGLLPVKCTIVTSRLRNCVRACVGEKLSVWLSEGCRKATDGSINKKGRFYIFPYGKVKPLGR